MDMLEEQAPEERYTDLNEEEDIIMKDSRQDNWRMQREVAEDDQDKRNVHALKWDVHTREKQELIKREFLVFVPHLKGGKCFGLV